MSGQTIKPNLGAPDDFYADLLSVHDGLSKEDSDAYNARLILLMANHIGDRTTLKKLLDAAHLKRNSS